MAMAVQGRKPRIVDGDSTGKPSPRGHVFDDLFVARYDESILDAIPVRPWHRPLPRWVRLAMEVDRRSDEYDVIVTWSERVSLSLMTLQRLAAARSKPHVAMLYWFSRPSVQLPLRAFGRSLHAIVTWSSVQREYAIRHLGLAPEKLYLVKHFVDQVFWHSSNGGADDMICSAGAEMRDYGTLLTALRGTGLRCHIASDHVRVDRYGFARRIPIDRFACLASGDVTIGRKPAIELRDLYQRSRFVVVPLHASDTDNGVNVILEAMAMGKPVICSRTRGQVDVVQDGATGIFVPVGDPQALREAMLELWKDPARARAMGRAAREHVERHHTLEKFCRDVKGAVDASLEGRGAARDGSFAVTSASLAAQPG
jgi:glycosyltransferase involved in cell wall biosynthesis